MEPVPCARMFCSCICDRIIHLDVHLAGGDGQVKPRVMHLGLGQPRGAVGIEQRGTSSGGGKAGGLSEKVPRKAVF